MITYYVHRNGRTAKVDEPESGSLAPDSRDIVWADVRQPDPKDAEELKRVFGFHPLSLEHALEETQYPKVEPYDGYLYVVLHGIDFKQAEHAFVTTDVDFFLGRNFLVTVHNGGRRSILEVAELCERSDLPLKEGPVSLMHRIVDRMVGHYRPEVDELENWLDEVEDRVLSENRGEVTSDILAIKRDIASLRRVVIPQRDVVSRLARREFDLINQEQSYRFRDVYDQLVRLADDASLFHDRVTGILDVHLASVSNQLALVSKVLAGFAVIIGPLTVITGLFGMNVTLPALPGTPNAQFWWITGGMVIMTAVIYYLFRRRGWL